MYLAVCQQILLNLKNPRIKIIFNIIKKLHKLIKKTKIPSWQKNVNFSFNILKVYLVYTHRYESDSKKNNQKIIVVFEKSYDISSFQVF